MTHRNPSDVSTIIRPASVSRGVRLVIQDCFCWLHNYQCAIRFRDSGFTSVRLKNYFELSSHSVLHAYCLLHCIMRRMQHYAHFTALSPPAPPSSHYRMILYAPSSFPPRFRSLSHSHSHSHSPHKARSTAFANAFLLCRSISTSSHHFKVPGIVSFSYSRSVPPLPTAGGTALAS